MKPKSKPWKHPPRVRPELVCEFDQHDRLIRSTFWERDHPYHLTATGDFWHLLCRTATVRYGMERFCGPVTITRGLFHPLWYSLSLNLEFPSYSLLFPDPDPLPVASRLRIWTQGPSLALELPVRFQVQSPLAKIPPQFRYRKPSYHPLAPPEMRA